MPARRAAAYAGLGLAGGQLLRRRALIAALIDIPIFARTTIYRDSQLMAALVLVRFLVALPVGAVRRRLPDPPRCPPGVVTAVGMALRGGRLRADGAVGRGHPATTRRPTSPWCSAASASGWRWRRSTPPLLASTDDDVHGVATALVVVARMVGMLVGISALTTIGLRRYYAEQADLPTVREVCGGTKPVRGVPRPAEGRRHRPGADGLPGRRGLRGRGRRAGAACCSAASRTRAHRRRGGAPLRGLIARRAGAPATVPARGRLRRPARRQP